jgi:hypothetical protein
LIADAAESLVLQRAQTAFAANEYGTARYWFELIRTWSPELAAVPLAACQAYCAAEASTDRADAGEPLSVALLLPSVGSKHFAAPLVRFRLSNGAETTRFYALPSLETSHPRTSVLQPYACRRKGYWCPVYLENVECLVRAVFM